MLERVAIILFLSFTCVTLHGQLVNTGCDDANFGVDGEVLANWALYGNNSSVANNVDDWFTNISLAGAGISVCDDSDDSILFPQLAFGNNINYTGGMSVPNGTVVSGKLLVDAVYMRDFHGGNLDVDSTAFPAGMTNGMNPNAWVKDELAVDPRQDIIDTYAHLRRNGPTLYDSLYFFFGLSRVANLGYDNYDVELFANDIQQAGGGFVSSGSQEGHTAWEFDGSGDVTQVGDILISVDFQAAFMPFISVFIWVSNADYTTATPSKFSFGGQYYGSGAYGYADLNLGIDYIGCGLRNTGNAWPPPWGTLNSSGLYATLYEPFQLTEVGINLARIGLDPAQYLTLDPCEEAFESVMFKSRDGFFLDDPLVDFVGPASLGPIPPLTMSIVGDIFYDCDFDTLTVNNIVADASYFWSTTGGNIVSRTDSSSIIIDGPGEYRVEGISALGCSVFDTINIGTDLIDPTFTLPSDTTLYMDTNCWVDTTIVGAGMVTDALDDHDPDPEIRYTDVIAIACDGTYTISRTWEVTDQCNNSVTGIQQINVIDTIAPTFTVPADTTIYLDNSCNADTTASLAGNVIDAVDNCDNSPTALYSDVFAIAVGQDYVITRTWLISDDCGNTRSGIQTITVLDTIKPFFTIPGDTTIYDCSADTLPATIGDVIDESDNCVASIGEATYQDSISFLCEGSYTIFREWSLTDNNGNQNLQIQTIFISDTTRPTFTVPPDTLVYQDTLCSRPFLPSDVGDVLDESDNCDSSLEATYVDNVINGSCIGSLTIERTWSLTDDCGNTSTALQIITVEDDIPPIFNQTVSDYTMECSDFFAGPPVITATDGCDTTVVAFQEVLINNASIVVEEDFNVSASGTLIPIVVTGLDNVAANVFQSLSLDFSTNKGKGRAYFVLIAPSGDAIVLVGDFCEGGFCDGGSEVYSPTFYACSSGNPVWNNVDNIPAGPGDFSPHGGPPTVTGIPHATNFVDCFEDFTGPMVGTWHVWTKKNKTSNGRIQGLGVDFTVAQHECLDPGYYSRKWVASDDCGNTNVMYQFISITDTEGPTFSVPNDTTLYYDSNCNYPDTTLASTGDIFNAFDWCDDSLTIVRTDSIVNLACHLEYQIYRKWVLTDKCDNSSSQSQIITILDVPPIMTCPPDTMLTCENPVFPAYSTYSEFIAAGGTISDNCEIVESSFTLLSEISDGNTCPELITRTYQISDTCGYTVTCQRIITINDTTRATFTTPPDITLYLDILCSVDTTVSNAGDVTDESDNCSGLLEATYLDSVSPICQGSFTISRTWTVIDDCGNINSQIQTIQVQDSIGPTFTVPLDIIVFDCGADTTIANTGDVVDELDNCSSNLEATYSDAVVGGCVGSYTVNRTWTLMDDCGNTTSKLQTIQITDTTKPTFTVPVDTLLYLDLSCTVDTSIVGTGDVLDEYDNCDTNIDAIYNDVIIATCGAGFTITRIWSLSDDCGNSTSANQIIIVTDTVPPSFTIPRDTSLFIDLVCIVDTTTSSTGVVDQNSSCSGLSNVSYTDSLVYTCAESYTIYRIWALSDACSNTSTQIQTISVSDTIRPTFTVPADLTVFDCGADTTIVNTGDVVDESDNCSTGIEATYLDNVIGGCTGSYTIERTWTLVDDCGNTTDQIQTITVTDTISPSFTAPADITVFDCGADTTIVNTGDVLDEFDNCSTSLEATYSDAVIGGCVGSYTVNRTWTLTDDCGNTTTQLQIIQITDTIRPSFTTPADTLLYLDITCNVDTTIVGTGDVVDESDNCDTNIDAVYVDNISATCGGGFTITRIWSLSDDCGNTTSSNQIITVVDTIPPTFTVPSDTSLYVDIVCNVDTTTASTGDVVDENSSCSTGLNAVYTDSLVNTCSGSYTIYRIWTLDDACSNSSTQIQTISVSDTIRPTFTVPADLTVYDCGADTTIVNTGDVVDESDNCSTGIEATYLDNVIGGCTGSYTIERTWTLVDDCGNTTDQIQTITVTDTISPSFTAPADITVFDCGADTTIVNTGDVLDEFDNCSTSLEATYSDAVIGGCVGSYTVNRTWTLTDDCGNTTTQLQTIQITDTIRPSFTTPADTLLYLDITCNVDTTIVGTGDVVDESDNCDTNIDAVYVDNISTTCGGGFTITRTWSLSDDCGNTTSSNQIITVVDTIPPTFTVPSDTSLYVDIVCNVDTTTASTGDVVDENSSCSTGLNAVYTDSLVNTCSGSYTIYRIWTLDDACSNSSTQIQTISVSDTIRPTFTVPADLTVYDCGADTTIVNTGDVVDESDNCSTGIEATYLDNVIGGCTGSYTIERTWTLVDDCGNTTDQIQTITVTDTISPSFTAPADITVFDCGADTTIVNTGDVLDEFDNCSTSLEATYSDVVVGGCVGSYTVNRTWTLTDDCGNTTTQLQTIQITDTIRPSFTTPADTLLYLDITCNVDTTIVGTGDVVDESDNCDTNIDAVYVDNISTTCGGGFTITRIWSLSDDCGNTTSSNQIITVVDTIPPTFTVPSDTSLYVDIVCNVDTTTASTGDVVDENSSCSTGLNAVYSDSLVNTCSGSYTIYRIWTLDDACSNTNTQIQTITVSDTIRPSFTVPADLTVFDCGADTTIVNTGDVVDESDNCSTGIEATYLDNVIGGCTGSYTIERTWTLVDDCGNTTDQIQTITVTDTISPSFTAPADITVFDCGADTTIVNTGDVLDEFDNCSTSLEATYSDVVVGGCVGSYTVNRTWTLTDDCGNTTTQLQTIQITDTISPSFTTPADTLLYLDITCNVDTTIVGTGDVVDESDNCDTNIDAVYVDNISATCGGGFTITRTWSLSDDCGNTTSSNQTITIVDTIPPTFTVPSDTSLYVDIVCNVDTTTSSTGDVIDENSSCSTGLNAVYTDSLVNTCSGSYTIYRIWTLDDACSNTNTQIQTITVSDTIRPTFTVPADLTVYDCGADTTIVNTGDVVDESDNCSSGIEATYIDNVIGGCTGSYTIERTWTLVDDCGNTTDQIQTITVTDTISPSFTAPADITVFDCGADTTIVNTGDVLDEFDNCSTSLEATYSDAVIGGCVGSYTVNRTWTLTDDCGNTTTQLQTIQITDTIRPSFTTPADTLLYLDITCNVDTTIVGTGDVVDESDNCDTNIDAVYVDNISATCGGGFTITRTWSLSDDCGNTTSSNQIITVVDTIPPTFTVPSDTSLYVDIVCNVDTTTASTGDVVDENSSCSTGLNAVYSDSLVYSCTNSYTIYRIWSLNDACSNTNTQIQTITVSDTIRPTFTVPADLTVYDCGADTTIVNTGDVVDESDNCSTGIEATYLDNVIGGCTGSYTIERTWTLVDDCGNTTDQIQTITVTDTISPSFTAPADITVFDCGADTTIVNTGDVLDEFDNCSTSLEATYSDVVIGGCVGSYTVNRTWTLTDDCGNTTTQLQTIQITDTIRPSFTTPADTLLYLDITCNVDTTIVGTGDVVDESDNCDTNIDAVYVDNISATCGGGFTITRTWSLSDDCGNTTSSNQIITVVDTIPPSFTVPSDTSLYVDVSCNVDTTTLSTGDVVDENSSCSTGLNAVYADSLVYSCTHSYTIYRIWTLDDACSNSTTQIQTITVSDTIRPTFTVPADLTVYDCGADTTIVNTGDVLDESDNCSSGIEATYLDNVIGGCTGSYTIERTWTLVDDCGNTTDQIQTITVTDTISPSFTAPADITVFDCGADTTIVNTGDVLDEFDNCSTSLEATYSDAVIGGCVGSYTVNRTWTLTDDCGNTTTQLQTIQITDTIRPSFTTPADTLLYLDITCNVDTTIVGTGDVVDESDNCDTNIDAVYVDNISATCGGGFTITRTWSLSDDCGNTTSSNQIITVVDTIPPSFTVPSDTSLYVDVSCNVDTTTLSTGDVVDENSSCSTGLNAVYADSLVYSCTHSYTIYRIWTLDDACSNSTTQIQTITVSDTIRPTFTVPADLTVYDCGADTTIVNTGDVLDESDNCSSGIEATYLDNVIGGCTGSYTIERTWTLVDDCGNTTDQIQTITVTDTISPSFTAPADITVFDCGADTTIVNTGDVLDEFDNCSTSLEATYSDVVVGGCVGSYTVNRTWTLTDDCGNTTTQLQIIQITDTIRPSFTTPADTLLYLDITCNVDTTIVGTGDVVDESDNCDTNIDAIYVDNISTTCGGGFTITRTWSLSDDCGNTTSSNQIITVVDTIPPTFTVPSDTSLYVDIVCNVDTTTASTGDVVDENSSCSTGLNAVYSDSLVYSCTHSYTIYRIWTLDDACSNTSTQIQTISVSDTIRPTFTVPADLTVYDCGADTTIVNTGDVVDESDNCSTGIEATYLDNVIGGCTGSYTIERTWTLVDDCGNTTDQIQTITVTDTISPSFTAPADITVFDCGADTTIVNTGDVLDEFDNCSTSLEATYSDAVIGGCVGSYTVNRTWTLTDDCGNTTTQLQTIQITDTIRPSFTTPADTLLYLDISCNVDTTIVGTGDVVDESDNCDTNIDAVYVDNISTTCGGGFTITRTWSLSDDCGNTTSSDQTITVVDTIPPSFTVPSDTSLYVDIVCNVDTTTSSTGDVVDENSSCSTGLNAVYSDSLVYSCTHSYTIYRIWTLDDACSNTNTQIQTITVSDTIRPTFTVPADLTVYDCGADTTIVNTGDVVDESDNCSTGIEATYLDNVIGGCTGSYTIERTWTLVDDCGNTTDQIQTITVTDTISPSFTAPADITVFDCGADTTIVNTGDVLDEFDNCSTSLEATYSDAVIGGCVGSYTVNRTWTLTDDCGNTTTQLQIIQITDTIRPSFTTPADTLLYLDITCNVDTTIVGTGDVVDESDNCDTNIDAVYVDNISATCGGGFTITRTWSLSDDCGNTTSSNQIITVVDTIPPSFTVPRDTSLYSDVICEVDTTTLSTGDVVDENSSCSTGLNAVYTDSLVNTCSGSYTIYRIWTLDDACSNTSTQIQTITVSDTIRPTFTVPADLTVYDCGADTTIVNTGDVVDESDNCSTGIEATYLDNVIGGCTGSYTIERTWTLVDDCGNTTDQIQTITVTDTISPSFTAPADITVFDCGADTTIVNTGDVLDEFDNCSTSLEATYSDVVIGGCVGSYTVNRTWTLTDDCGNTTTQLQTIQITDTIRPSFTTPADTLLYLDITCNVDTTIVGTGDVVDESDNCDTNIDAVYVDNISTTCGGGFTITRTWSLSDDCGNTTSSNQIITVADTIPPTFTVPRDTSLYVDIVCNVDTTTASTGDVVDENSSCSTGLNAVYSDSLVYSCTHSYTIYRIWTLDDACSNTNTQIQTITVSDTIRPTFTVPADLTVYDCGADTTIVNTGDVVDESDNCSTGIEATYLDNVIGGCTGSYTIERTWTLVDDCGNSSAQIQTITVTDTISPSFTAPADITVFDCGADTTIVNTGDVLDEFDNCSTSLEATYSDVVIGGCVGSYTVNRTWTLTDDCGNTTTQLQTIQITDTIRPSFTTPADTLLYLDITCNVDTTIVGTGDVVDESDNCDTNIDAVYVDNISATCGGGFTITRIWSLSDDCGNTTSSNQIITVVDTIPPTFTVPSDTSLYVDIVCNVDTTTASTGDVVDENSSCSTGLNAVYSDSLVYSCTHSYTIYRIWTLDDACSNTNTQIQTITVSDTIRPTFTVPADLTVYDCGADTTIVNTGDVVDESDNCSTGIEATYLDNVIGGCTGSYTIERTWTLVDDCGNTNAQIQTITVTDTISPSFTAPADITVFDCGADTTIVNTGDVLDEFDNCSTSLEATYSDVVIGGCVGSYTVNRTWTLTDDCGNTTTQLQTIQITDTISPSFTTPADTLLYLDITCNVDTTIVGTGDVVDESDNCDTNIDAVYVDNISATCGGGFTITRIWSLSDDCGNTTSSNQTITVVDTIPPTFTVPRDTSLYVDIVCNVDTTTASTGDVVDENSSCSTGLNAVYTDSLVNTCSGSYTIYRIWTLDDACSNTNTQIQTITVSDTIRPTFTVPADLTVYDCGADTTIVNTGDVVDESDNCSTGIEATYLDNVIGGCTGSYTIERTWTLVDDCGNSSAQIQTITVTDTISPSFTAPADITVFDCGADTTIVNTGDVLDEFDNCSTSLEATYSDAVIGGCVGSYTVNRTWTLTDDCGNTTTQLQTIQITDTIRPSFTTPADTLLYLDITCNVDTTIVGTGDVVDESDNCDTNIDAIYVDNISATCGGGFTITRTWSLSDDCGNTTSSNQMITVVDTIPPSFTVPSDTSLYVDVSCNADTTTLSTGDVVDENSSCSTGLNAVYSDSLVYSCTHSYTIYRKWTLDDACSNTNTQIQTITVSDTIRPTFTVPADLTVYDCGADTTIVNTGDVLDESDNCSTGIEATYLDNVIGGCTGSYTIERTWTLVDDCGNTTDQIQTITVTDTISPSFTAPADITVFDCGADTTIVNTGDVLDEFDNCSTSLEATYSDAVIGGCVGSYTVNRTWTLTDDCGNTTTQLQTIQITDTIRPSFTTPADTLLYLDITCNVDTTIVGTGDVVDESDNCDTNIDAIYVDNISATCGGGFTITRTWSLSDDCGNSTSEIQVIQVLDTVPPTLVASADTTIYIDATCTTDTSAINIGLPSTAQDNCSTNLSLSYTDSIIVFTDSVIYYEISRIWELVDDCGNSSFDIQVISVLDTFDFIFANIPSDTSIVCGESLPPVETPLFVSTCDTLPIIDFIQTRVDTPSLYQYTIVRTWKAEDRLGNIDSTSQIIVVHECPPSISLNIVGGTFCEGESVNLDAMLSDTLPTNLYPLWYFTADTSTSWMSISGSESKSLQFVANPFSSGWYKIVFSTDPLHTDPDSGFESAAIHIDVLPNSPASSINRNICEGEYYSFGGSDITVMGDYTHTFMNINGCDSIVNLHLDVHPISSNTIDLDICEGDYYQTASGIQYFNSGTFSDTLTNALTCDSILTINLNVIPHVQNYLAVTVCPNETYEVGNKTYIASGTYTDTFTSSSGCDSIVTLDLTVLSENRTATNIRVCQGESYNIGTQSFNVSGSYQVTLQASSGCDSIVELDLEVLQENGSSLNITICEGQSFTYNSKTFSSNGTYEETLISSFGCDSVVSLSLVVLPTDYDNYNVNLCTGESYILGSQTISSAGTYTETFSNQRGCDSLVTIDVTLIASPISGAVSLYRCDGDSVFIGGVYRKTTGEYSEVHTSINGCDSIEAISLEFNPAFELIAPDVTVCRGEEATIVVDGASAITWESNNQLSCLDCPNPIVNLSQTTTFSYSAVNCEDQIITQDVTVNVLQPTRIDLPEKISAKIGEAVRLEFQPSDPFTRVDWFDYNFDRICTNCTYVTVSPGFSSYYYAETVDNNGCVMMDSILISLRDGCEETTFDLPNYITPNGDGQNDEFVIRHDGLNEFNRLFIFNRWGEKVFEATDLMNSKWDGKIQGGAVNPGVYMYVIKYTCLDGQPAIRKGNITVLK